MATHSSVIAWRISGTGEPVGLPSMGLHRVGHDWSDLAAAAAGTEWKDAACKIIHREWVLFGLKKKGISKSQKLVKVWSFGAKLKCLSFAAAAAKSLQPCPTLCNPIDGSPPGSPVPGILQARTLEWVAVSFSNAWKWKVKVKSFSHVQLFATPRATAHQAPPSVGFSRQEYWSELPLPSPFILCWLWKKIMLLTKITK